MSVIEPEIKSLVCGNCWMGLFAPEGFQNAWSAQKLFDGYSYSTSWKSVKESADTGCNWCGLVRDALRDEGEQITTLINVKVNFRTSDGNAEMAGKHTILRLIINNRPISMYYLYAASDNIAASFIEHRNLILDIASTRSYELAKQCLTDCALYHADCLKPERSKLPTRLIDCSDPSKPKIYVRNGMAKDYYATLSYVWGEKQLVSTTLNIQDHVNNGLNTQALPQTIKDAIATTHSLDLRYLWVDALCILQDSPEDKDRELAQMGPIYQQSYVTIIAANASKVSHGFLAERPNPMMDVWLPFRCPNRNIGTMKLSPVWKQYNELEEPVNKRAWCLQERLLPSRALIYASHTLQYHCQTHTINIGNSICLNSRLRLTRAILPSGPNSALTADPSETRRAWNTLLDAYSQRSMTEPGDKLVAIAGIAERFHKISGNTRYLAGLWEHTILSDLLWFTNYQTRQPRPAKYRAPSWSWAAVDGHMIPEALDDRLNPTHHELTECEILEVNSTPASEVVPFGAVRSSILKLNGVLIKNVRWDPASELPSLFFGEGCVACAYPDSAEEASATVCVIPLRMNRKEKYAAGLILMPENEQSSLFRRVGYFHSSEDWQDLRWLDGLSRTVVLN